VSFQGPFVAFVPLNYIDPSGHHEVLDDKGDLWVHPITGEIIDERPGLIEDNLWPTEYYGMVFDQIPQQDQEAITQAGISPEVWNIENLGDDYPGGVRNLAMTSEDPILWTSLAVVGIARYGPAVARAGKEVLTSASAAGKEALTYAGTKCLMNPVCARVVFGVPRNISPNKLSPNPNDPFSDPNVGPSHDALHYHREYILQHGTTDGPIYVQETAEGYQIIDGHHKWLAALQAGLEKVRIEVIEFLER
jgi:hypothetical protein